MFRRPVLTLASAALLSAQIGVAQELKPYLRQAPAAQQAQQAAIPDNFCDRFEIDVARLDQPKRAQLAHDFKARLRSAHQRRDADEALHYFKLLDILENH